MIITNKGNLPLPFVRCATPKKNPSERRGSAEISVTELLGPPRVKQLRDKFWDVIVQDASEMFWMLLGGGIHNILQANGGSELSEKRLFAELDGCRFSGQFDLLTHQDNKRELVDYKMCNVWAVLMGRQEWEEQLNIYRYLLRVNNMGDVDSLKNVAILRNWSEKDFDRIEGYPTCPVVTIEQKVWDLDRTVQFIKDRIKAHRQDMPECDMLERWRKGDTWAIMSGTNKRATAVFDSEREAKSFIEVKVAEGKGSTLRIEPRPGEDTRCLKYCSVWEYCDYGRKVRGVSIAPPPE